MRETVEHYLADRKAKGTLGTPKTRKWEGRTVYTGYCPCKTCDHFGEAMLLCDPDYNNCLCCDETCS
jgi:hypothetical protein